jgi:hypothetical protein
MRVVDLDKVPKTPRIGNYGLSARVFAEMLDNPGKAVEVPAESKDALKSLRKRLGEIADKEHRHMEWSRSDDWKFGYFWILEREVAA